MNNWIPFVWSFGRRVDRYYRNDRPNNQSNERDKRTRISTHWMGEITGCFASVWWRVHPIALSRPTKTCEWKRHQPSSPQSISVPRVVFALSRNKVKLWTDWTMKRTKNNGPKARICWIHRSSSVYGKCAQVWWHISGQSKERVERSRESCPNNDSSPTATVCHPNKSWINQWISSSQVKS